MYCCKHKVHLYLEYHSVRPIVGIGPPPHPFASKSLHVLWLWCVLTNYFWKINVFYFIYRDTGKFARHLLCIVACVMTLMCVLVKYFWMISVFFIYQRLWEVRAAINVTYCCMCYDFYVFVYKIFLEGRCFPYSSKTMRSSRGI